MVLLVGAQTPPHPVALVTLEIAYTSLSVQIDEAASPASGSGRIEEVLGGRCTFDGTGPGRSVDILLVRGCGFVALGILYEGSGDAIRAGGARRRRPGESVGGGDEINLARARGERSRRQRYEAGRHIGCTRLTDWIRRCREQFDRHRKSAWQRSIYRQFRPI